MDTRIEALIKRAAAAAEPDHRLSGDIARAFGWSYRQRAGFEVWRWYSPGASDAPFSEGEIRSAAPDYTGDLSTVVALVERELPDRTWDIRKSNVRGVYIGHVGQFVDSAPTPTLALLLAFLHAKNAVTVSS